MENTKDIIIEKNRKYNQTLYKFYKMISWDLLFYYAISYLFLVQTKNLSTSQIIFADAFYPLFKLFFQLPLTFLIEKIGKKNSLIFANICVATYILIVMGLTNTFGYIIANFFCAIGFIIKDIAESNLLYDFIENNEKRNSTFSKIDSTGSSLYYFFDAITSISAGFLFVINPYLPMCLCLAFSVLSVILTFKFKKIPKNTTAINGNIEEKNQTKSLKENFKISFRDLKEAFRFIAKSKRLRALILFYAFFNSLLSIMTTLRRSLLSDLNVPDEYFGIIFAVFGLISAYSSASSNRIQKGFGNSTLSFLSFFYIISVIFSGLTAILIGLPPFLVYFIVLSMLSLQYAIKGPFYTLIKRYLGSFSTSSMRTKISSANIFIDSITRTIISFIVSYLTSVASSAISILIIGISFAIIMFILLSYMKTRVGLKPEEYPESDIKFTELY